MQQTRLTVKTNSSRKQLIVYGLKCGIKLSWTEPSIRWVSSSRVGLVVGKKPNLCTTHPVADLALEVAGGWWTRFAQIPLGLQLLNASYFKLFYS